MKPKSTLRSFLLAAGSSLLAVSSAYADQIWDGGSGIDSNWNTADNWDSNVLPNFANAITFTGTTQATNVNDLTADTTIGGINFTNATAGQAFSISGARITLGGDITTTASSGAGITDTVSLAMILNDNRTITTNTLHYLTLSGIISETGGARNLIKGGAGTLTLSGDNSYTGVTTIGSGAGRIIVAHNNALGTTAGNTTILANGTNDLYVNSGITTAENITITGTTEALGYASAINGGGTLSGTITLGTGSGDIRMGGVTFSGTITQTGTRILVLNGTTINNAITINGAKLSILNGTSILKGVSGSGIGQTALDQGGVLQLGVTNALNTANDLNIGTYTTQNGTVDLASYNQTIRGLTSGSNGTARKVINSVASTTSTLTVGNSATGDFTFSGTILDNDGTGGTVALVKTGTRTQTLSGTSANTYSGTTTVNGGILALNKTAGVNAIAGAITLGDGAGNDILRLAASNQIANASVITFNAATGGNAGIFRLNNQSETVAGIASTGGGGIIENESGSAVTSTLTVNNTAAQSFSGIIRNGDGSGTDGTLALTKTGGGTLELRGANTYTGATTVNGGTLMMGANNVIPNASNVTIGTATLDADTRTDTAGTLNVTGTDSIINLGTGAALAFANSSGVTAGVWAGTLNITGTFVPGNDVDPGLGVNPGSIRFGTDNTGLSPSQLAAVEVNGSGAGTYVLDTFGYLKPSGGGPSPVNSFTISAIASPQTVGTPITGITITAKDASNVTATSFTGTVTFGGTGGFTGTSASFVLGELSGVSVTPTVAGSNLTFTVDDGATHTGSATITTIQTQYQAWAGGALFNQDANGDGVSNGMAFLLGASGPNVAVTLPTVTQSGGDLVLSNFSSLNLASRGAATLSVQHSSDLGIGDPWTTVLVPEATAAEVSGVSYNITPGSPLNTVNTATISVSQSAAGKLFGRLKAVQTP